MRIAFFGDSLTAGKPGASYFERLGALLPDQELLNYGRGGDSVSGAYELISSLPPGQSYDQAFLWIGTNDVFLKVSPTFPMLRVLRRQSWTKSREEFTRFYRAALVELSRRTNRIFAVSPWFVGEDAANTWNRELDQLSAEIKTLAGQFENTRYIDLRATFKPKLAAQPVSPYVARSLRGIARDLMTLNTEQQVNGKAAERGLTYTLDGVHLNGRGAEIIARIFAAAVNTDAVDPA